MPELCSAITGLLYSSSHNNTLSAITSQKYSNSQRRMPASLCVAIDQGVVTPIGPVLTSATAVKMVKTEIKEWSSGQGSLEPL